MQLGLFLLCCTFMFCLQISATDQHTDGPSQPLRPIYNVAMGDATQAPPTPDWAVRYEPGRMSHESAL